MLQNILYQLIYIFPGFLILWGGPLIIIYLLIGSISSKEQIDESRYKFLKYATFWTLVWFCVFLSASILAVPKQQPIAAAVAISFGLFSPIIGYIFFKKFKQRRRI